MAVFCAVERASEAVGRRDAAALRCHGERTGGPGALLGMRSVRAGEVKASSAAHAAALAPREAEQTLIGVHARQGRRPHIIHTHQLEADR